MLITMFLSIDLAITFLRTCIISNVIVGNIGNIEGVRGQGKRTGGV